MNGNFSREHSAAAESSTTGQGGVPEVRTHSDGQKPKQKTKPVENGFLQRSSHHSGHGGPVPDIHSPAYIDSQYGTDPRDSNLGISSTATDTGHGRISPTALIQLDRDRQFSTPQRMNPDRLSRDYLGSGSIQDNRDSVPGFYRQEDSLPEGKGDTVYNEVPTRSGYSTDAEPSPDTESSQEFEQILSRILNRYRRSEYAARLAGRPGALDFLQDTNAKMAERVQNEHGIPGDSVQLDYASPRDRVQHDYGYPGDRAQHDYHSPGDSVRDVYSSPGLSPGEMFTPLVPDNVSVSRFMAKIRFMAKHCTSLAKYFFHPLVCN